IVHPYGASPRWHGLWMMPNVYAGQACKGGRGLLVVSPRGTLSPVALKINARQKAIFWRALQAPAIRRAACFHATAESEYADIRRAGFRQPICVLPNGVDVPAYEKSPEDLRRTVLFLGRIHPIKGLDTLLRAWSQLEPAFPAWKLQIAGPDSRGHLETLQALSSRLGLQRVAFSGPVFGDHKLRAYREASLFVLPSHSENFGMAVAEALAAGTPAVVLKGAPWEGLNARGAGWWIDAGVDPLAACLTEALAMSSAALAGMGRAGREWMVRDFSWQSIAHQWAAVYRWLGEGSQAPRCVRTA
ncbi:MAG: glycosyltransferase, partial [Acidobacteriota bacterium]